LRHQGACSSGRRRTSTKSLSAAVLPAPTSSGAPSLASFWPPQASIGAAFSPPGSGKEVTTNQLVPEGQSLLPASLAYTKERPPLRISGYTARWVIRASNPGLLETDFRTCSPGGAIAFAPIQFRLRFGVTTIVRRKDNADRNA
jgi:hypothetical protein